MPVMAVQLWLQLDDYEWSERYDLAITGSLQTVVQRLVRVRSIILAQPCRIDRASIWDVTTPKTRTLVPVGVSPQWTDTPQIPPIVRNYWVPCGDAGVTVNFAVRGEHGHRRVMHFAGIPIQAEVDPTGGSSITRTKRRILYDRRFVPFVIQFREALCGGQVVLMMRERLIGDQTNSVRVLTVDQGEQGLYRITTEQPLGLGAGEAVKFDGPKFQNGSHLRGIRRIRLVESPTVFHLDRGPLAERGPVSYQGGGIISQVSYAWTPCSPEQEISWIDVRRRGGRQPARRGRKYAKVVS